MAKRVQFMTALEPDQELADALRQDSERAVSEEELAAQKVSFAYGNAGNDSRITKDSVQKAASSSRLCAQ